MKDDAYLTNEKGTVMAVLHGADNENTNIIMETRNNKVNQQWKIVYVDEWPEEPKKGQLNERIGLYVDRDFYVVSALPSGRYLDYDNKKNMNLKTKNGKKTQVWYFHQKSLSIRSRSNNMSWDIVTSGNSNDMRIFNTNYQWYQMFKYENKQFVNMKNSKVLDVKGGQDKEGRAVGIWGNNRGKHQQWRVVYLDEPEKKVKKEVTTSSTKEKAPVKPTKSVSE
jgi:hypothetical protein